MIFWPKRPRFTWVVCALLLTIWASAVSAHAQEPTHKDIAYADQHKSQRLDVYTFESDQPAPAMIFIHGGGWRAGSKRNVPGWLRELANAKRAVVVAVEYRFTDVATHPAQVNDCMRAIQFTRLHAKKWNIDTKRIGVTGGSAGGHLSAYVTLHDDAADPQSDDPVERESSRVQCGVSFAGPTDWSLLNSIEHKHPAYRQLIGHEPGTAFEKLDVQKIQDVSPITFASKDDPPLMQVHGDKDVVVPLKHAESLHAKLKATGVFSQLVVIPEGRHNVAGAGAAHSKQAKKFVTEQLGLE